MSKNISKPAVFIFLNAKTKETVKLAANLYTLKPSLAHLGLSVDIVRNELSDFHFVSNLSHSKYSVSLRETNNLETGLILIYHLRMFI